MLSTASIIMRLVLLRNTLQQNSVMVWGTPASLFKGKAEEEGRLFAVSNNSLVTPRDSLGRRKWSERSPLSSNKKVDHHCPLSDFTVAGPRCAPCGGGSCLVQGFLDFRTRFSSSLSLSL